MADTEKHPLTGEEFDKTIQQLAKVIVAASEGLRLALERNTKAVLTQTIEIIKGQTGTHNVNSTDQSIAKSVEATFSRLAK